MSYVEPSVSAIDAQTLAGDVVTYLADSLPPARTTLVLNPPAANDKDQDALTEFMLSALSEWGYGILLFDPKTGAGMGVPLRYLVSPLDSGVLLRLQYQGGEVSRYYPRDTNGQLLPVVPFTVRMSEQ